MDVIAAKSFKISMMGMLQISNLQLIGQIPLPILYAIIAFIIAFYSIFFRKEQPRVSLHLPPVGWHNITLQFPQRTTVWAWEKTTVSSKHPGHRTSMKKLFGFWINLFNLCFCFSTSGSGFSRSYTIFAVLTENLYSINLWS